MIERIIAYSIRNPFIVVALSLAVAAAGVYALYRTPIDAIPDLSENQVIVFADWMGRSPREVEDQVTYPLSVNLQGLAGVKAIRATSEFGFSMINIIFEDHVDFYFARERVLERLSIAETFLPRDVKPYLAPDATALGQIFWYTVEGDGYDLGRLRAVQDWFVRYQLYSVPGVAEVASVGGYPIEYQIDVDPAKLRAYDVTLGELYSAVARSNSAVGGRVVQKAGSEFLIRSVGWIESLDDVRNIVVKRVGGTPVYVSHVADVQFGSAPRRSSLEKDGNEVVGGVVLMRYEKNPLEVTKAIKQKIAQLQPGLPPGVRITPFYDRTRLIEAAVGTVRETLLEEMLVASAAVIFVMRHLRSALVICITLPMAALGSFILMRLIGIPSNIMSLSGIAISIGVLVDAAIVMVDQGAHTLHLHFGEEKVRGDTRALLTPALQTVGRPIFFSLLIMVVSFIPVFALGGMEGRMFHPLAYTKTFALAGVSILAITLVPAIMPWLMRGRIRGETENWLVRRVIEIYQPVVHFLLDHPWPIVWLSALILIIGLSPAIADEGLLWAAFRAALLVAVIGAVWAVRNDEPGFSRSWRFVAGVWAIGIGCLLWAWPPIELYEHALNLQGSHALASFSIWVALTVLLVGTAAWLARRGVLGRASMTASLLLIAVIADRHMTRLGREFMPALDEGTILDMPVTVPRASITQATDDLKARDAVLRQFPELEMVVGKAGRAETPTDPAPPDMVETMINLRPHDFWPKRELRYEDAHEQTVLVLAAMESRGWIDPADDDQRISLANDATMHALSIFDESLRAQALAGVEQFEATLPGRLAETAVRFAVQHLRAQGKLLREVGDQESSGIASKLAPRFGDRLRREVDAVAADQLNVAIAESLSESKIVQTESDLFALPRSAWSETWANLNVLLGRDADTFAKRLQERLARDRDEYWREEIRTLNWRLFDTAGGSYTWQAILALRRQAEAMSAWRGGDVENAELQTLRAETVQPFARQLFLWQRTKDGLVKEMDTVVRMPGWGNIWTQPIINRVDMLATGVRTMIGVKVYGDDLNKIQESSVELADALRAIPGAVDVFPDQIVGEGYLEIDIDRERAARYGVNVGDVQDVVETALGGQTVTTTVEGRERFPVRIRYARDFRLDEESVKELLVSGSGGMNASGPMAAGSATRMAGDSGLGGSGTSAPQQIPLAMVADVRIVEGPSMIKSENGLLRAYVQLNVRDRDIVGFVEEAQRVVAEQVKLPAGMYLEWSGQFEHQVRARRTLSVIFPMVILAIFLILYVTYHDFLDTLLVIGLAVPGAVAGGAFFQWLFGFNFSVAVWVGYIACFGLSTENGLVMLVYLREAIRERGGLENLTLDELRDAIMHGAVHRTRPKLLTETTTIIGLAPMLWAVGTGAEIMRPMAAPVLGGILVSDEVVDLLLPVLFYRLRRWQWRRIHCDKSMRVVDSPPSMDKQAALVVVS